MIGTFFIFRHGYSKWSLFDDDELLSPDFEAFLAASIAAIKQDPDVVVMSSMD